MTAVVSFNFRDNLDAYFDKQVRENILNEKLSR